jgi:hypothetical protein
MKANLLLSDLLPGDKIKVAGIEMSLDYFSGPNPVFTHQVDNKPFYFIDRSWTGSTKISQVR